FVNAFTHRFRELALLPDARREKDEHVEIVEICFCSAGFRVDYFEAHTKARARVSDRFFNQWFDLDCRLWFLRRVRILRDSQLETVDYTRRVEQKSNVVLT